MAVARSTGAFIGTSESSGTTIANNATSTGSEVDLLGDNTSVGWVHVYMVYDSTSSTGTIDVRLNRRRLTTQAYANPVFDLSWTPANATGNKVYLGYFQVSRFVACDVKNNGLGASLTNFALLYELEKLS